MELFKTYDDALTFALRFSSQQYAQSPMAKRMKQSGPLGQGKGLHQLDGSAQAAFILRRLDEMEKLQRAAVVARFSARVESCPCCGNDTPLPEYKESILLLAHWAQQFVSSKVVERLLYAIVQDYFERRRSVGKIAESLGIAKRTAYDQKAKIWPQLSLLDKAALMKIESLLTGMVGEVAD